MADQPDYTNNSQQCLMAVVEYLSKNILFPQSLKQVTEVLEKKDFSRDAIFRALWNLEAFGWVEQTNGGGYLLSPTLTKFSDRLRHQLVQFTQQYLEQ